MVDPANETSYETLVQNVFHSSDYDFVGIAMQGVDSLCQIKWRFVRGNISQRYQRIILRNGIGIAGLVLRTGQPFYGNDLQDTPQSLMYTPISEVEKLNSAAAIPLLDPQTHAVIGVLLAGYRNGQNVSHETITDLLYYLGRA